MDLTRLTIERAKRPGRPCIRGDHRQERSSAGWPQVVIKHGVDESPRQGEGRRALARQSPHAGHRALRVRNGRRGDHEHRGHVSGAMLSRCSQVRMEAKRRALDEIAAKQRAADEKSTALPSRFSRMAMCVIAVVGVAPCQCFSPGGNHTTSPGRIASTGPPSRCAQTQPAVAIRI